jgi:lipopolysaccharide transport system ATP-binding protein
MKETPPSVISLKHVSKLFYKQEQATLKELIPAVVKGQRALNSFWALDNISLDVKQGEVIGIVGSNGSGKSTLLKLIAGVTNPTKGSVTAKGRIVPLIELGAGFHGELTGRENIYLNGIILGMSRKEIDTKIKDIITFAELSEFIDQPIKHYSSGMYLRLAFSVAVHLKPDIVLIDEILSVGDENFQRKSLNKIQEIISQQVTVVIVSHSLDLLSTLCTRILWIEKGKLRTEGKPSEVIAEYRQEVFGQRQAQPVVTTASTSTSGSTPTQQPTLFKEWGNFKAKITTLEVGDADQKPRQVFTAGDTITLSLEYDNPDQLSPINVAFGIYRYDDVYIAGMTTVLDEHHLAARAHGRVSLQLKDIPLTEGQFYVRAALFGTLEADPYHFWHRGASFEVQNIKKQSRGMLKFARHWRQD